MTDRIYQSILVALDGSEHSRAGGELALHLARRTGAKIVACHVYGAELHNRRFKDMEPGLEPRYREEPLAGHLRQTHVSLIMDGLLALSRGYMEQFLETAARAGVDTDEVNLEGRNYVKILESAAQNQCGLIVLGAQGLGRLDDGMIGSTALRVLRQAPCDVLIARKAVQGGAVIIGIDGSRNALNALEKARAWVESGRNELVLAAVYDPFFHNEVFKTMAQTLSPDYRERVGLAQQEQLHHDIIDHGLACLYRSFLDEAGKSVGMWNGGSGRELLQGKAYRRLVDIGRERRADLLVVGRSGHHHQEGADIGSNAEAVVRLADTNVLVVCSGGEVKTAEAAEPLPWDPEAEARLAKVPEMARKMARRGVEDHVRSQGQNRVTLDAFAAFARRIGMPSGGHGE